MRNRSPRAGVVVLVFFLLFPVYIIWDGFVISVIWNWFMPKIFGLIQLSIPEALDLSLMVSILVNRAGRNNEDEEALMTLLKPFGIGILVLLMGFIVQMFI